MTRTRYLVEGIRQDFEAKLKKMLGDEDGAKTYERFFTLRDRIKTVDADMESDDYFDIMDCWYGVNYGEDINSWSDISYWMSNSRKQSEFIALQNTLEYLETKPSNKQQKHLDFQARQERERAIANSQAQAEQGSDLIYEDDTWEVRRINTLIASQYYGQDTNWCICGAHTYKTAKKGRRTAEDYFEEYRDRGVTIYFLYNKNSGEKFAYSTANGIAELFDQQNNFINSIPNMPRVPEFRGITTVMTRPLNVPSLQGTNFKAYVGTNSYFTGYVMIEGEEALMYAPGSGFVMDEDNNRFTIDEYNEKMPEFATYLNAIIRQADSELL